MKTGKICLFSLIWLSCILLTILTINIFLLISPKSFIFCQTFFLYLAPVSCWFLGSFSSSLFCLVSAHSHFLFVHNFPTVLSVVLSNSTFFFFLAGPHVRLTRDQTLTPCIASIESQLLDLQRSPQFYFPIKNWFCFLLHLFYSLFSTHPWKFTLCSPLHLLLSPGIL